MDKAHFYPAKINKKEINNNSPATKKIWILYLESTINHGNKVIILAIDAPIPSATKSVGKAQQIKVLTLVNKLKEGEINCLNILPITTYFSNIVTGIGNYFCY